eukprot:scaffold5172_cov155-Amphora_coffeaeformis.AAC.8
MKGTMMGKSGSSKGDGQKMMMKKYYLHKGKGNGVPEPEPTPAPAPAPTTFRILHINDHHSHLEAEELDVEITEDFPASLAGIGEVAVVYGGFPLLVPTFAQYESEAYDIGMHGVLKLHAGDAITGTSYYSLFNGVADLDMMNLICFDAFVLGNHEFDDGDSALADFISLLTESRICPSTPVLSANLMPGPDSALLPLKDALDIASFAIYELENGRSVGIIGITVSQKTLLSSSPDEGTDILDEVESVTSAVASLQDEGVDIIVVLSHTGINMEVEKLALIPGVDVVVGGDSHSLLGDLGGYGAEPQGPYPIEIVKEDNTKTCFVTAWEYSHIMGFLDIEVDGNGDVVSCSGSPIVPMDPVATTLENGLTDEQASDFVNYVSSVGPFVATTPDRFTALVLSAYQSEVDVLKETVIATVDGDICFERIPGQGRSVICDVCESATQGGGACNLVAQAFLDRSKEASVAIQNGGGCRTDIGAGDLTIDEAISLLPFSNTLVNLEMTGEEIKMVLEEALEFAFVGGSSGAYPYAAGLRYAVDSEAEFGSRVSDLLVNPRLEGTFEPIDLTASYTVVTNNFVSEGRDGYITFGEIEDKVDTFIEYSQAFIDYATEQGTIADPPREEYSTSSYSPVLAECL